MGGDLLNGVGRDVSEERKRACPEAPCREESLYVGKHQSVLSSRRFFAALLRNRVAPSSEQRCFVAKSAPQHDRFLAESVARKHYGQLRMTVFDKCLKTIVYVLL